MLWRVIESWFLLLYLDAIVHFHKFKALHEVVRKERVSLLTASRRKRRGLAARSPWLHAARHTFPPGNRVVISATYA